MYIFFLLLALFSGMIVSIQGIINSEGAKIIGLPTMLVFFSFVQLMPALFYILIKKPTLGVALSLKRGWKWYILSGLLGTTIAMVMALSISKIGALTVFVLVILGQIIASAIADQVGLFGIKKKKVNKMMLISMMFIIIGVTLLIVSDLRYNVAFILN